MKKNITLKELSRSLNVSVSTVSKALNDSPEISSFTKNKIRELAELNNYIPNAAAQSLKKKRTRLIGVIVPDVSSTFFAEALSSMEHIASSKDYQVIVCFSNDSSKKEEIIISHLIKTQVDGIIISLAQESQAKRKIKHIKEITSRDIPLVLFDRIENGIHCDSVSINEELQAELATNELFSCYCKNILYLSGIANTSVNDQRKKGYYESIKLKNKGIHILEYEDKKFPFNQFLNTIKKNKIDGIIAADEFSGIISIRTLLKEGYKVPQNVSVITYNNGLMSEFSYPSLSVVDQQTRQQAEIALETVIDRIENKLSGNPIDYKLKSFVLHRETTIEKSKVVPTSSTVICTK